MEINWTLLIPIIVLQLILQVIAIVDLVKQDKLDRNKKILWAIVILIFSLLGPIIYFVIGRREN